MSGLFDPEALAPVSYAYYERFRARFPERVAHCGTETFEGLPGEHLRIEVPSPIDPFRNPVLWMNDGEEPSLGFGSWHVHELHLREVEPSCYEEESLLDLLAAILADQFVLVQELGPGASDYVGPLDLRTPNAVEEELTDPYGTGHFRLLSFTGAADRECDARGSI